VTCLLVSGLFAFLFGLVLGWWRGHRAGYIQGQAEERERLVSYLQRPV